MLSHHEFITSRMTTRFVERHFNEGLVENSLTALEKKALSEATAKTGKVNSSLGQSSSMHSKDNWENPFQGYWRGV
jgi:hypothetical protein